MLSEDAEEGGSLEAPIWWSRRGRHGRRSSAWSGLMGGPRGRRVTTGPTSDMAERRGMAAKRFRVEGTARLPRLVWCCG